jgi:hypothetical protein
LDIKNGPSATAKLTAAEKKDTNRLLPTSSLDLLIARDKFEDF